MKKLMLLIVLPVLFANVFAEQNVNINNLPSGLTKDNFDYLKYIHAEIDPNVTEINQAQKDFAYKDAVTSAYKSFKKDFRFSDEEALSRTVGIFSDGYEILGKARPKSEIDQKKDFTLEGFNSWAIPFIKNNPSFKEFSITDLSKIYLDDLNAKNGYTLLKSKGYSKAIKANLRRKIKAKYGNKTASSLTPKVSNFFFSRKMIKSAAVTGVELLGQIPDSYKHNENTDLIEKLKPIIRELYKIDVNKEINLSDHGEYVFGSRDTSTDTDKLIDLVAKIRESKDPILSYFRSDSDYRLIASGEIRDRFNKATPEERKKYIEEIKSEANKLSNIAYIDKSTAADNITQSNRRIQEYDNPKFSEAQKIARDIIGNAPQVVAQVAIIALGSRVGLGSVAVTGSSVALGAQAGMQAKTDALMKGKSLAVANRQRDLIALAETGTEFVGGKFILPLLKLGGSTSKKLLATVSINALTEGLNAPIQELIKSDAGLSSILNNPDLSIEQKTVAMFKLSGHSFAVGAGSAGLISSPIAISVRSGKATKSNTKSRGSSKEK